MCYYNDGPSARGVLIIPILLLLLLLLKIINYYSRENEMERPCRDYRRVARYQSMRLFNTIDGNVKLFACVVRTHYYSDYSVCTIIVIRRVSTAARPAEIALLQLRISSVTTGE